MMGPLRIQWMGALGIVGLAVLGWTSRITLGEELTPAPTLEDLRQEIGYVDLNAENKQLFIRGSAKVRGANASYELTLGAGGAFRHFTDGPLATLIASDGEKVWQRDAGSAAFEVALLMKEAIQLGVWFETGSWLSPDTPIVVGEPRMADAWRTVLVKGGLLETNLTLDQETQLPARIDLSTHLGNVSIEYSDYRRVGSVHLPFRTRITDPVGLVDEYYVHDARFGDPETELLWQMPPGIDDTTFDATMSSDLKVRRIGLGHLAVKPTINGRQAGWFVFDSGAGASVITPRAAKRLGLQQVGRSVLAGSGANVSPTTLRGSDTFQLGPMTVNGMVFMEMDIGAAVPSLSSIAGVVGWDILIRARVELGIADHTLRIYDSALESTTQTEWQTLVLHGKQPHVRGGFEGDHWGLFSLDTGAANTTIVFHSPTVTQFAMIKGNEGPMKRFRGAGGFSRYVSGQVAWVELAGHRYTELRVRLSLDQAGSMADPYVLGNIGIELLRDMRLLFDYPNNRIALLKR